MKNIALKSKSLKIIMLGDPKSLNSHQSVKSYIHKYNRCHKNNWLWRCSIARTVFEKVLFLMICLRAIYFCQKMPLDRRQTHICILLCDLFVWFIWSDDCYFILLQYCEQNPCKIYFAKFKVYDSFPFDLIINFIVIYVLL